VNGAEHHQQDTALFADHSIAGPVRPCRMKAVLIALMNVAGEQGYLRAQIYTRIVINNSRKAGGKGHEKNQILQSRTDTGTETGNRPKTV
jgi:hypothetical protein